MISRVSKFRFNINKLHRLAQRFSSYKGVTYTPIILPKLSPTVSESKIDEWLVKEGDFIDEGDTYCNIETDKATMNHDSLEEGYIAKIFHSDEKISVNSLIGVQVSKKEDMAVFKDFKMSDYSEFGSPNESEKVEKKEQKSEADSQKVKKIPREDANTKPINEADVTKERKFITPLANKLAKENSVDIGAIIGSGRLGAIVKNDVLDAAGSKTVQTKSTPREKASKSPGAKEIPGENYIDVPVTPMRSAIASRLFESKKNIPHFAVSIECNVEKLIERSRRSKGLHKRHDNQGFSFGSQESKSRQF